MPIENKAIKIFARILKERVKEYAKGASRSYNCDPTLPAIKKRERSLIVAKSEF
ncbi:hypothetical protein [Myxosarcina sp. GI1(2024)]